MKGDRRGWKWAATHAAVADCGSHVLLVNSSMPVDLCNGMKPTGEVVVACRDAVQQLAHSGPAAALMVCSTDGVQH